jgi:hypothetical protein
MRLLLIESTPGTGAALETDLRQHGHEVVSCNDDHGGPCRGVEHHRACPMEEHIDMTIVARSGPRGDERSLNEMGAVCSSRHRVPMVEVDTSDPTGEMPSLAVASALATRRIEAAYVEAVRGELGTVPAMVDVRREPSRVHATIQIPQRDGTQSRLSAVADRARHALREHDPFVSCIDVSVVTYPDVS